MSILCVNAGSSSLKLSIRDATRFGVVASCDVEDVGEPEARVRVRDAGGRSVRDERRPVADHAEATRLALAALEGEAPPDVAAVGHRVVHGGRRFVAPALVDGDVLDALRSLTHLAPLHLPPQIAVVEAMVGALSEVPHVACFDTAFHRAMPEEAQRFPLPEWAWEAGICRYGFHGLSYEHAVGVLGPGSGRVVIAHLGNGASMAAVADGRPVDTTMAFTPAAGLMMGTRTGDLDPGLLLHLLRDRGMDVDEVDRLVNHEAGLVGVSGSTSDMRTLLADRATDPRADRAVAMFCRIARKHVGALAAALGGLDQLVFTGGIGERAPAVREEICRGLEHLGIALDASRNARGDATIGRDGSACHVRVIPAEEDAVIARHTAALTAR